MKRLVRQVLLAVFLAAVGWLSWCGYTIWSFGAQDRAQRSDCAIVLGAAVQGDEPSPVFAERLRHAVELHRRGLISRLLLTGGRGAGADLAESSVGAEYAMRHGVPASDILIETRSHTTQENLAEAKAMMQTQGLATAVIVSDPLHLKRAAVMAQDLGISAVTSPTPTSRYRSTGPRLRFLLRELYFYHHYLVTGH